MDVNPDDIPRYGELKQFVISDMERSEYLSVLKDQAVENPEIVEKYIQLLEDIFGYHIAFYADDERPADFYIEGSIEEKRSAIEQVYNLGVVLFHFLNDLGLEIMQSAPEETSYILWAQDRIEENPNSIDPEYEGLVLLPESNAEVNAEFKIVYLGSKITRGAIAHEVSHELDRRMGDYGTIKVEYEEGSNGKRDRKTTEGPIGSFHWFLRQNDVNRLPTSDKGFNFRQVADSLREDSRAAGEDDKYSIREIFADALAAKVLGRLDEPFYSTARARRQPIGFEDLSSSNILDIECAIEQYFDRYAESIRDDKLKPENFGYAPNLCK